MEKFIVILIAVIFTWVAAVAQTNTGATSVRPNATAKSNATARPNAAAPASSLAAPAVLNTVPDAGDFAFGASLGSNGSFSAKYWITNQAAVDFGSEYLARPWKVYYSDFLWHFPQALGRWSRFGRETSFYVGAGLGAGFWKRSDTCVRWHCNWSQSTSGTGYGFFARALAGIEWYPLHSPHLGVFLEFGPSYLLYPSGKTFDGAIGGRYYF